MSVVHTVLVVDDDMMVRALAARVLALEGYCVLTASDGEEALRIARASVGQLSVVVTDIRMPEMDGTELAAHLARLTPAPPVLFVSGFALPKDDLPGPVLPKPFTIEALTGQVRAILQRAGESSAR
jgi:two-component system, cell cycle sensor histidine kinase and response regulator CckA